MVGVLRSFLDGTATRAAIVAFTRDAWPDQSKQGTPFERDGIANTVFDSIWNAEEQRDGEYLLRESDFRSYIEWLNFGDPLSAAKTIIWIRRYVEQVAEIPNAKDTRFWMDGLGWHTSVELASLKTGRRFIAAGPMTFLNDLRVAVVHTTGARNSELMQDLMETFGIGSDEIIEAEA